MDIECEYSLKAGMFGDQGGPQTVYQVALQSAALPFINKTGVTQLRLSYAQDDNDNGTVDLAVTKGQVEEL